jgi:acetyl-CoA C-acetyltransferase
VIWSTSSQKGKQGGDLGRMAALDAGFDVRASGMTLDRFCGGGITAVNLAAAQIMSGMEDLVIAGGTEMMSLTATMAADEAAAGFPPGLMGAHNASLDLQHPQSHQGVCGDAIASMEGVSRADLDAFALESQRRAAQAIAEGRFNKSIIPVKDAEGRVVLAHDEYPRPETTADGLAKLKPAFEALADMAYNETGATFRKQINRRYPNLKIEHMHHAGNSSGVVDGAAAVLLASRDYAVKHGLKPRGRVVAMANVGDDPTLMLNAPVPAAKKVLEKAGLTKDDIDLWEINEAFAIVPEKFIRDLGIDRAKVNVNGGAIALGHPIGATGAILIGTVLDELERTGGRFGLVTMCAAGGMAPAIVVERIDG